MIRFREIPSHRVDARSHLPCWLKEEDIVEGALQGVEADQEKAPLGEESHKNVVRIPGESVSDHHGYALGGGVGRRGTYTQDI